MSAEHMQLSVNGEPSQIAEGSTVADLVASLRSTFDPIAAGARPAPSSATPGSPIARRSSAISRGS